MINIRPDEISSIIRQQIEQYDQNVKVDNIGIRSWCATYLKVYD